MIKIASLNKESEEESRSEEEVTKEALEQIALQQYQKALELQRKGNLSDATKLLKDLLDTELLANVEKPAAGKKVPVLFNLKYLCYKNLASMLSAANEVDAAIEAYGVAAELQDTDITLWHRLGLLCIRASRYEMALHAFQRGVELNPKHWPCLDKIVTLLLGLDYKEECISTIYDTLQLDPGYLRGLVYRRHIFMNYPYIRDFMERLNPMYKWNEKDEEDIDEEKAVKLLQEVEQINEEFLKQQRAEKFHCTLPNLKLNKPITSLTWQSVGESLVQMHKYMSEHYFSHACPIEIIFEKGDKVQPVEKSEEVKESEPVEKTLEDSVVADTTIAAPKLDNTDISEKDKTMTDLDKTDCELETAPVDSTAENISEPKKKLPPRRRGSALSFLEQWEWCNKRRSGRKKTVNRQDRLDGNIYETLRRIVPLSLAPETIQKTEMEVKTSTETFTTQEEEGVEVKEVLDKDTMYFGTETEQDDVKQFIEKHTDVKKDIIDLLHEYLDILSRKWNLKWPENLPNIYIEANTCYKDHVDSPAYNDDNKNDLLHFTAVNLLVEEFVVNDKLNLSVDDKQAYDLSSVETINMILYMKPHIFTSTDLMEFVLRLLWVKLHIHILDKCDEFALDCLYQLSHEFEIMGENQNYSLSVVNFTFKPIINHNEILAYIKFLERNKKLSTVMDLYERGNYDEVLSIITDSFEHCKDMAKKQEEEMSLDFAVQLSLILDTYWALDRVDDCFKWSLTCLHEALKHYFRYTSGSTDYEKWTRTVVKILSCMEHILTTEGLSCIESVTPKELSQGLEDLIRIIGHQVETSAADMPFGTVMPWIIMHYILQREEDQGRGRTSNDNDKLNCDEVPNPLMVIFIAHEHLGNRGWCSKNDGKLLYFILDTVVPQLRSPYLSKSLEQVCLYMEQCVYCLFGHPGRKNKLRHLIDHNVSSYPLDWKRAQQLYEIFKPSVLPALEGKISGITADTEQLFHRVLALLPPECDPQKYCPEMEKYIKGIEVKLPSVPPLLPYKMKDIYFLLGDYYFKKEEHKMAIKFNTLDVIVNNDRLESWAQISLSKAVNLGRILNSCKNLNNEREVLNPAKAIIRCFKRSLELDPTHCNMWIEYGIFVYTVHSFCSRLLKQASESLSMEDFENLEKQKEDMLDTTHKCFMTVLNDLNDSNDPNKANEEMWLHYYMLGKVAEKRNKPPSEYLKFYMLGVKSLQETDATYPLKINYSSPTHLCIEVLELHYRIHASILKYIEQHENKPIPASVGKVFANCIEEWKKGPFTKKIKKDGTVEAETDSKTEPIHAANILKRSISDAGEEETFEAKRLKLEAAAAKVRRSASYDTERLAKDISQKPDSSIEHTKTNKSDIESIHTETKPNASTTTELKDISEDGKGVAELIEEKKKTPEMEKKTESSSSSSSSSSSGSSSSDSSSDSSTDSSDVSTASATEKPLQDEEIMKIVFACLDALEDCASRFPQHYKAIYRLAHYHFYYKKGKDIERCRDLMLSNFTSRAGQKLGGLFSERKHTNFFNNIWKIPIDEVDRGGGFAFHMSRSVLLTMEILKEIDDHKTLLELSLHLQRIPEPDKTYLRDSDREELAQQAFSLCVQSLKGQLLKFSQQADLKSNDVEQQALKSLMLDIYRAYQRAQKQPNSKQFTTLLVDAYKLVSTAPIPENINLIDISMKYCQSLIQTLKQQATQASLDKSQNSYKKQSAKAVAASASSKASTSGVSQQKTDYKAQAQTPTTSTSATGLPKMSAHEMAAAFQSFLPVLNDPVLAPQTAAALSYLSNITALAGYPPLQNTLPVLQNSVQNSFQAEFYRQFFTQSLASFNLPQQKPKQKRGPKPGSTRNTNVNISQPKQSKSFHSSQIPTSKPAHTSSVSNIHKSTSAPLAPSMGTVLSSLPASMTANLSSFGSSSHTAPSQAHMSSVSTINTSQVHMHNTSTIHTSQALMSNAPAINTSQAHMSNTSSINTGMHNKPPMPPHIPGSPGKTLQEKLAEKQKNMPPLSLSKLPSSLTITKTSVPKKPLVLPTKTDAKKTSTFGEGGQRPKPITSDEVIVLDD